jgi:prepilin-type N-terminal cleavage/methylation domain-containing protein
MYRQYEQGFSIPELLVAIVIAGISMGFVVMFFDNAQKSSESEYDAVLLGSEFVNIDARLAHDVRNASDVDVDLTQTILTIQYPAGRPSIEYSVRCVAVPANLTTYGSALGQLRANSGPFSLTQNCGGAPTCSGIHVITRTVTDASAPNVQFPNLATLAATAKLSKPVVAASACFGTIPLRSTSAVELLVSVGQVTPDGNPKRILISRVYAPFADMMAPGFVLNP